MRFSIPHNTSNECVPLLGEINYCLETPFLAKKILGGSIQEIFEISFLEIVQVRYQPFKT